MQETLIQSLGWEDPLEEEMATHSSILAWRILWTEEPGGPRSIGSKRVRHDLGTKHALVWSRSVKQNCVLNPQFGCCHCVCVLFIYFLCVCMCFKYTFMFISFFAYLCFFFFKVAILIYNLCTIQLIYLFILLFFKIFIFIYLTALGLSYSMQDVWSSLQPMGSLSEACEPLARACRI